MGPRRFAGSPTATSPRRRSPSTGRSQPVVADRHGRPEAVAAAFEKLPDIMNRAEARSAQVDSAVLELAEAIVLADQVGQVFDGRVTDIDERGARIQIVEPAVLTRIPENGLAIGEEVRVRLTEADPSRRLTRFTLA